MSLKDFKDRFLEGLLTFLWRQWSAMGVMGTAGIEDEWVLDPEALVPLTFEAARYEPRLFDEVVGWMSANGELLDATRLRAIILRQDTAAIRTTGAVLLYLASIGHERKWGRLAQVCRNKIVHDRLPTEETLFRDKEGKPFPRTPAGGLESAFQAFRLYRPRIRLRENTGPLTVNAGTHLRFLLRSLFGPGGRSECLAYLLTHDGGTPSQMAASSGLTLLSVMTTLKDMSRSGLVLTRKEGKRISYWVSQKRWWEFLSLAGGPAGERPKWLNWISVSSSLLGSLRALESLGESEESEYIKTSRLHDHILVLSSELAGAGLDIPPVPSRGIPPEMYQRAATDFMGAVFGMGREKVAA